MYFHTRSVFIILIDVHIEKHVFIKFRNAFPHQNIVFISKICFQNKKCFHISKYENVFFIIKECIFHVKKT